MSYMIPCLGIRKKIEWWFPVGILMPLWNIQVLLLQSHRQISLEKQAGRAISQWSQDLYEIVFTLLRSMFFHLALWINFQLNLTWMAFPVNFWNTEASVMVFQLFKKEQMSMGDVLWKKSWPKINMSNLHLDFNKSLRPS